MKTHLLAMIAALSITITSSAQTVDGYSYSKFPVKSVFKGGKAPVNYSSNPTARSFRTQIKNQYKGGKVDFAGYYVTVTWGCGTGCTVGAMVDVRDGKVYDLPDSEINSDNYCNGEDHKGGKPTSRMYVTSQCGWGENNTEKPTYTIFLWNEEKKKFVQLKNKREKMTGEGL